MEEQEPPAPRVGANGARHFQLDEPGTLRDKIKLAEVLMGRGRMSLTASTGRGAAQRLADDPHDRAEAEALLSEMEELRREGDDP